MAVVVCVAYNYAYYRNVKSSSSSLSEYKRGWNIAKNKYEEKKKKTHFTRELEFSLHSTQQQHPPSVVVVGIVGADTINNLCFVHVLLLLLLPSLLIIELSNCRVHISIPRFIFFSSSHIEADERIKWSFSLSLFPRFCSSHSPSPYSTRRTYPLCLFCSLLHAWW